MNVSLYLSFAAPKPNISCNHEQKKIDYELWEAQAPSPRTNNYLSKKRYIHMQTSYCCKIATKIPPNILLNFL